MNNLHSQIFQILQVDNSTRDLMFYTKREKMQNRINLFDCLTAFSDYSETLYTLGWWRSVCQFNNILMLE